MASVPTATGGEPLEVARRHFTAAHEIIAQALQMAGTHDHAALWEAVRSIEAARKQSSARPSLQG
jgi:hypothetical protein